MPASRAGSRITGLSGCGKQEQAPPAHAVQGECHAVGRVELGGEEQAQRHPRRGGAAFPGDEGGIKEPRPPSAARSGAGAIQPPAIGPSIRQYGQTDKDRRVIQRCPRPRPLYDQWRQDRGDSRNVPQAPPRDEGGDRADC